MRVFRNLDSATRGKGGSPSGFPFRIALHEEVASTNDEVKRALEAGEPEGLVVRALRQVSGYGPAGSFVDQPGRRTVLLAVVAPPGGAARTSHVEPGCGHGGAPRTRCAGGRAG